MKTNQTEELTLFDRKKYDAGILENISRTGEMLSLTDLWKAVGNPENKEPAKWQRLPETERFIDSACKFLNVQKSHIIKSTRGKGGGTIGVRQIFLEYSKYIDSDLAVIVNEVFFQRIEEEKNPDLIIDRAISTYKKKGYDDKWISLRLKGKGTRNEFTSCLAAHGVKREGFRDCTNAIYSHLYGGSTSVIREKKSLPEKANIRDSMTLDELTAVGFAEMLARNSIKVNNLNGNGQCEIASTNASKIAGKAVMDSRKSLIVY